MPLVTGTEDRQWLYVAMTRGRRVNWACRVHPVRPDRRPGGRHPARARAGPPRAGRARTGRLAWLSRVKRGERSRPARRARSRSRPTSWTATAPRSRRWRPSARALADADHLADAERHVARRDRRAAGGPVPRRSSLDESARRSAPADELASPQATWLWRTLRAAEAAGLDAREVGRARRSESGRWPGPGTWPACWTSRIRQKVEPAGAAAAAAVVRASAGGGRRRSGSGS